MPLVATERYTLPRFGVSFYVTVRLLGETTRIAPPKEIDTLQSRHHSDN